MAWSSASTLRIAWIGRVRPTAYFIRQRIYFMCSILLAVPFPHTHSRTQAIQKKTLFLVLRVENWLCTYWSIGCFAYWKRYISRPTNKASQLRNVLIVRSRTQRRRQSAKKLLQSSQSGIFSIQNREWRGYGDVSMPQAKIVRWIPLSPTMNSFSDFIRIMAEMVASESHCHVAVTPIAVVPRIRCKCIGTSHDNSEWRQLSFYWMMHHNTLQ